eukprot:746638-Hanusia_phi.AAC.7
MSELHLALLVVRLCTNDATDGEVKKQSVIREVILPHAYRRGDRGLLHACYWNMELFATSSVVLWSILDQERLESLEEQEEREKHKVGSSLLTRLGDDDDEGGGRREQREQDAESSLEVGPDLHPCTETLLQVVHKNPKMRIKERRICIPKPRDADMKHAIIYSLTGDGCALFAESFFGKARSPPTSPQTQALACQICLARLAEMIRAEGSKHASTGENQVDLLKFKQVLLNTLDGLRVSLSLVTPLLVRFCLIRGFWRLAHALVTGFWEGSMTSRTETLAQVAIHPLTSAMADSITDRILYLDYMGNLPRSALSRLERKGKFLQLVLHSLSVDNHGDTGALAVLAASVMTVHFLLIWTRRDFDCLKELMTENEGIADDNYSAALSWLMQACNPSVFHIGSRKCKLSDASNSQLSMTSSISEPSQSFASLEDACTDDDNRSEQSDEGERKTMKSLVDRCADSCLMWILVCKFLSRLRLALSGPSELDMLRYSSGNLVGGGHVEVGNEQFEDSIGFQDVEEPNPRSENGGSPNERESRSTQFMRERILESEQREKRSDKSSPTPHKPELRSAQKVLQGVSQWAKKQKQKTKSLNSIQDHLKAAVSNVSTRLASPVSSMSRFSDKLSDFSHNFINGKSSAKGNERREEAREAVNVSHNSMDDYYERRRRDSIENDAKLSSAFFSEWEEEENLEWQKSAPQIIGKRLLGAIRGWRERIRDFLLFEIYATVLEAG